MVTYRLTVTAFLGLLGLVIGLVMGLRALLRHRSSPATWIGLFGALALSFAWLQQAWRAALRHGDEATDFHATLVAGMSGFDPVDRAYPAFHGIVCGGLHALAMVGRGLFSPLSLERVAADTLLFETHWLVLLARFVSILSCLGILALVYRIASDHGRSRFAGLLAALALLGFAEFLRWPYWVSPHPLALFLGLAFLFTTALKSPLPPMTPRRAAALGVLFGIALSTHYFAVVLAPAIVVPLLRRKDRTAPLRALSSFGGAAIATFLIINHPLFTRPGDYFYIFGRHAQQLVGHGASILVGLAVLGGLIALVALAFAFAQRLGRTGFGWRLPLPLLALALPAAAYLLIFHMAVLVLPWYLTYPAALLTPLAAILVMRLLALQPTLWRGRAVVAVVLALPLIARALQAVPTPTEDICFDDRTRGRTIVTLLTAEDESAGPVGVFDNSLRVFETAKRLELFGGWLTPALSAKLARITGREVLWLDPETPPERIEELAEDIETIIRFRWPSTEDEFNPLWIEDFELMGRHEEGECRLKIYRRR